MNARTPSRVIAVDPGYDRIGIAIFEKNKLLHSECFIPQKGIFAERLSLLFKHLQDLIEKYKPNALATETLFFTKNQKTGIQVAEARGVILLSASLAKIPVFEYSPQQVKIAVTGFGRAEKAGVIKMVQRLIPLEKGKRLDDEYDAIALGIAHQSSQGSR